jgi:hypothetical protein
MLVVSGHNGDVQWFDYRPSFFGQIIRVEWDRSTKYALLPNDVVGFLLARKYARVMSPEEIAAYTAQAPVPAPEPLPEAASAPVATEAASSPPPVPQPKSRRRGDPP